MQIGNGLHAELLRELHRSLGADARYLHQLQRRLGDARPALLDHCEFACAQVFADFGTDALADPVDLFDAAFFGHDLNGFVVMLDARGGVAIVRHPIAVFAQKFHRVGELAQDAGDLTVLHASSRARAKMASNMGTVNLRVKVFC